MRLSDGRIGRVQSLVSGSHPPASGAVSQNAQVESLGHNIRNTGQDSRYKFQDDYREDPTPVDSLSLGDYVRIKPAKKKGVKRDLEEQAVATQEQLETEFPTLDTALIAAITADHQTPEDVREVLRSLS